MQEGSRDESRAFSAAQSAINRKFQKSERVAREKFQKDRSDLSFKRQALLTLTEHAYRLQDKLKSLDTTVSKLSGIATTHNSPDFKNVVGAIIDEKENTKESISKAIETVNNMMATTYASIENDIGALGNLSKGMNEAVDIYRNVRARNKSDQSIYGVSTVDQSEEEYGLKNASVILGHEVGPYEKAGNKMALRLLETPTFRKLVEQKRLEISDLNARAALAKALTGKKEDLYSANIANYRQYNTSMQLLAKDAGIPSDQLFPQVDAGAKDVRGALERDELALANFIADHYDTSANTFKGGKKSGLDTLVEGYKEAKKSGDPTKVAKLPQIAKSMVNLFLVNSTGKNIEKLSSNQLDTAGFFSMRDEKKDVYFRTALKAYKSLYDAYKYKRLGSKPTTDLSKIVGNAAKSSTATVGGENNNPTNIKDTIDDAIKETQDWLDREKATYKARVDSTNRATLDLFGKSMKTGMPLF